MSAIITYRQRLLSEALEIASVISGINDNIRNCYGHSWARNRNHIQDRIQDRDYIQDHDHIHIQDHIHGRDHIRDSLRR